MGVLCIVNHTTIFTSSLLKYIVKVEYMPSIFHGLLLLWMNYPPFMMHIRCIILYAVKLDFYGAVAFHPPLFLAFLGPQRKKLIHSCMRTNVVALS